MRILVAVASIAASGCATASVPEHASLRYRVTLDEAVPLRATIELADPPTHLLPARDGRAAPILDVACDGRPLTITDGALRVPTGCAMLRWSVQLVDQDSAGVDASVPPSLWSPVHRFWFLAERHGFLRPANPQLSGRVTIVTRWVGGGATERTMAYPSLVEPPFYAVAGAAPAQDYRRDGVRMPVWGTPPAYSWIEDLHAQILAAWARWRRDVVSPSAVAPDTLDFAWLKPAADMEPGYNASAGFHAIGAQLRLRPGDPSAESKSARGGRLQRRS